MKPESGATTIIMTSLMLGLLLMLVMANAKGLLYQIKHSNDYLDSRRSYWRAEGGLECAYAKMRRTGQLAQNLSDCIALLDLDELIIEQQRPNIIRSSSGYVRLSKAFYLPEIQIKSPITTRSHFLVNGNLKVAPSIGQRLNHFQWQCYSLRYAGALFAKSFASKSFMSSQVRDGNLAAIPSSTPRRCSDSHYTRLVWKLEDTQKDFQFEPSVDPFKEVFNVERSEWFSVMSDTSRLAYVPHSLRDSIPSHADRLPKATFNQNCAESIISLVRASHDLIWVFGGCELNEQDIHALNLAIDSYLESGLMVVFHNGIVSISAQQPLKGFIYHLVTSGIHTQYTDWPKTRVSRPPSILNHTIAQLSSVAQLSEQTVSYFQHGHFHPLGGLVLDAPNSYALVSGGLNTEYRQQVTQAVARDFHFLSWAAGSWYDF